MEENSYEKIMSQNRAVQRLSNKILRDRHRDCSISGTQLFREIEIGASIAVGGALVRSIISQEHLHGVSKIPFTMNTLQEQELK